MANQDVSIVQISFDALNNGRRLGIQVPSTHGGITVISAAAHITGTANITLVTMSNVGTPALNGTITNAVGGTATAGVPYAFTISDGWVQAGEWIAVQENNIGTPTRGHVTLSYRQGRGTA